jgi:hypothetical protein
MKKVQVIVLIILIIGCKKNEIIESSIPCDPLTSYSSKVKNIFVTNCTLSGCHDGNPLPSLADYNIAHDASAQIRDAVNRNIMPINGNLSSADKAAIICWIDNGAKNN